MNEHEVGLWCICGHSGDGVRTFDRSFIHLYLTSKPSTASSQKLGRKKKLKEDVAKHLAQFTEEGEQGHVSPNTRAP